MTTCGEAYTVNGYGYRPNVLVPCMRELLPEGRHRGQHQGWQHHEAGELPPLFAGDEPTRWEAWASLWTWSEGSAHGTGRGGGSCTGCAYGRWRPGQEPHERSAHALVACTQCGVLEDPLGYFTDAQRAQAPDGSCFSCSLWWVRAEQFAGRMPYDTRGQRGVRPVHDSSAMGGTGRLYTWCPGGHGAFGGTRFSVLWDDGAEAGPDDVLWDGGAIPWWLFDAFPENAWVERGERVQSTIATGRMTRGRMGGTRGNEWPDYTGSQP